MHARADAPADQAADQGADQSFSWPEDIFTILQRFDVRQVPYVPDAGHSELIQRVLKSQTMRGIPLTTEEEGVALLAGAWAGGQRGVLLMQSSGVGNCINMLSLTQIFRLPFLTLGDDARRMGRVQSLAGADGIEHARRLRALRNKGIARDPSAGSARGDGGGRKPGLQRLHADRGVVVAAPDRDKGVREMSKANLLNRRDVVSSLLRDRKDAIVVGGLGASTYDIAAAGDHNRNFYLWGAMGGAVMIGLGLALAQPKLPVVVITGDGEMLMGMGSLATVGLQKPANLSIVVLDNESYGETGGQMSHTASAADLVGVARACGIADARRARHPGRDRRPLRRPCRTSRRAHALPASRSTPPTWSACCPTATACLSSLGCAVRSGSIRSSAPPAGSRLPRADGTPGRRG